MIQPTKAALRSHGWTVQEARGLSKQFSLLTAAGEGSNGPHRRGKARVPSSGPAVSNPFSTKHAKRRIQRHRSILGSRSEQARTEFGLR